MPGPAPWLQNIEGIGHTPESRSGCGKQYDGRLYFYACDAWTPDQSPWIPQVPITEQFHREFFTLPLHIPEHTPDGIYTIYLGLFDHYTGELVALDDVLIACLRTHPKPCHHRVTNASPVCLLGGLSKRGAGILTQPG